MAKRKYFSLSEKYELRKKFDSLPVCSRREASEDAGNQKSGTLQQQEPQDHLETPGPSGWRPQLQEPFEKVRGQVVWARLTSKWWPAMIVDPEDCGRKQPQAGQVYVFWFGDHRVSNVPLNKILPYDPTDSRKLKSCTARSCKNGIEECAKFLQERREEASHGEAGLDIPEWIKNFLLPNYMLEPNTTDEEMSEEEVWDENRSGMSDDDEEMGDHHDPESAAERVRAGSIGIREVCISCNSCPRRVARSHPVCLGSICFQCEKRVKRNMFAIGNDGKNIYCAICCREGLLFVCENKDCNRSFCKKCINIWADPGAIQKIEKIANWCCFYCNALQQNDEFQGLLMTTDVAVMSVCMFYRDLNYCGFRQPRLRVLSLFDGIGTGRLVLDRLKVGIDVYYASEVDNDAIMVSKKNHFKKIIYLGDIKNITEKQIKAMCPLDLVLGASPCNELSGANPKRKGLSEGTGLLVKEFQRVLEAVIAFTPHEVFWLFENVASMPSEYKHEISSYLGREPLSLDAKYFSAQCRHRLFWGNIPGMKAVESYWKDVRKQGKIAAYFADKEIRLSEYVSEEHGRKALVNKIRTVTTNSNSLKQKRARKPVLMGKKEQNLWITELEKIFGFPEHYTDTANLSNTRRQRLLGNSWSCQVIEYLLKPLNRIFQRADYKSLTDKNCMFGSDETEEQE